MSDSQLEMSELYAKLCPEARRSLLDFARYLCAQKQNIAEQRDVAPAEPQPQPIPQNESVMAAIKRLQRTYSMLDTKLLFNETSSLMTAHMVNGKAAGEVIQELESLFDSHYQRYRTRGSD